MNTPRPASIEERIQALEWRFSRLWEEVWWHQIPWWTRLYYWLQGFRSPILNFYADGR